MLGACPLEQPAEPAWEVRRASWWEETTKWSIKVQVKREEGALRKKQDKQTTRRGECSLVREHTARLACLLNFLACLMDKKQWIRLHI